MFPERCAINRKKEKNGKKRKKKTINIIYKNALIINNKKIYRTKALLVFFKLYNKKKTKQKSTKI